MHPIGSFSRAMAGALLFAIAIAASKSCSSSSNSHQSCEDLRDQRDLGATKETWAALGDHGTGDLPDLGFDYDTEVFGSPEAMDAFTGDALSLHELLQDSPDKSDLLLPHNSVSDSADEEATPNLKCPPDYNIPCPPGICGDSDGANYCATGFAYPCRLAASGTLVELVLFFEDDIGGCQGHCAQTGTRHYLVSGATCTAELTEVNWIDDPACEPQNYAVEPVVVEGFRYSLLWKEWKGDEVPADELGTYPSPYVPPPTNELEVLAIETYPEGEPVCIVKVPLFAGDLGTVPPLR